MRKLLTCSMVMALLSIVGPQQVSAQNGGGFGGVMEWLSRLSGPQFGGSSVSLFTPDLWRRTHPGGQATSRHFRLRIMGGYHGSFSSDDVIDPDGSSITMTTFQPMLEIPIWPLHPTTWHIEGGIGFAWHWFDGAPNAFRNESIPVHFQFVREIGNPLGLRLDVRAGVGAQYWMKFADSDFLPIDVTMDRNVREVNWKLFAGFDWHVIHLW